MADSNLVTDASTAPLLDRPVDRGEYVVGPGDIIDLSIVGELNQIARMAVGPEGTIVIPGIGSARVHGLTLDEAERHVARVMAAHYRNVSVKLSLAAVRSFKIYVLGDVQRPGVRVASSAMRVSEVAPLADTSGVMRRNVIVRRTTGDTLRVDLLRFAALGDVQANPALREGDAVYVPKVEGVIHVIGHFAHPATVEYRAGETLAELLLIANGGQGFRFGAADTLRVARVSQDGRSRQVEVFTLIEAVGPRGSAYRLRPHDAIYLAELADYAEESSATITGQVTRPGTYPIGRNATTVQQLVEMAGGFRAGAAVAEVVLYRIPREARRTELEAIPPEDLTSDERRILQAKAAGDPSSVVLDFSGLLATGRQAFDQPLQDGDTVYVPRLRQDVTVLGAVVRPGIVRFEAGQQPAFFVKLAGGYSKLADRRNAVVLRGRSGARLDAEDVKTLEPGDQIVVPFRERVTFTDRLQRVQAITGSISAIIVTYLGIRQIVD